MLITFNFFFFLSGVALLGVGIWLLVDKSLTETLDLIKVATDDTDQIKNVSYVLIGVGAFVFIVGFLGCCGALKESKCMLGLYIFLLLIVMGIEIAAGVLALFYKAKIEDKLDEKLKRKLNNTSYYNETVKKYTPFGISLNFVQQKFKCCGVEAPSDYKRSKFFADNSALMIPYSCCKLNSNATELSKLTESSVEDWGKCKEEYTGSGKTQLFVKGCKEGLIDWAQTKLIILTGVGLGIACLELFGFIFAVCLCRNVDVEN
jgi:hypothetical protein